MYQEALDGHKELAMEENLFDTAINDIGSDNHRKRLKDRAALAERESRGAKNLRGARW